MLGLGVDIELLNGDPFGTSLLGELESTELTWLLRAMFSLQKYNKLLISMLTHENKLSKCEKFIKSARQ
jgi:hypothetical protein